MALKALSMRGIAEGLPGVLGNNWEQTTKYCREPGNLNFFKGTQEQVDVEDGGGRRLKTDMLNREEIYKKKTYCENMSTQGNFEREQGPSRETFIACLLNKSSVIVVIRKKMILYGSGMH